MAYDAGDLSVKMKVKPYLSDYLTIKHTLQALEYLYGDEKSTDEMVQDDGLLSFFFPRERFDAVRNFHKKQSMFSSDDVEDDLGDGF